MVPFGWYQDEAPEKQLKLLLYIARVVALPVAVADLVADA